MKKEKILHSMEIYELQGKEKTVLITAQTGKDSNIHEKSKNGKCTPQG